jgi:hypothetical protein
MRQGSLPRHGGTQALRQAVSFCPRTFVLTGCSDNARVGKVLMKLKTAERLRELAEECVHAVAVFHVSRPCLGEPATPNEETCARSGDIVDGPHLFTMMSRSGRISN